MNRFISTIFMFIVISGCGSSGDKIDVRTPGDTQIPEIPELLSNNDCVIAKGMCEGKCVDEPNTSSCQSCCKVTYYHCLNDEGKQNAGGPEYLATHEAKCGKQCEKTQEEEWNKVVFKWGAFDPTRNPFANKPPSLSHAENCLANAHAECVSTRTFPLANARCCIAQSCEILADEVLARESEKCTNNPTRTCQAAATKSSQEVLMQCQSTYRPCRRSLDSSP